MTATSGRRTSFITTISTTFITRFSAFGKNTSAMGVTINKSLDPDSPDYKREDQGIVVQSVPYRDLWNAIDYNVVFDDQDTPWLACGSFWDGHKLVKLAPNLTEVADPQDWYTIAKRERPSLLDDAEPGLTQLEAPFIKKATTTISSFPGGLCCRGNDSTYKIMIGRF